MSRAAPAAADPSWQQGGGTTLAAEALAARLPALLVEAERVAETVRQGVHGRRRVGIGESFWQFRPYTQGDQRIDWRQSGKSDRLYVRETEWEAAQTVQLWRDPSGSMEFRSDADLPTKQQRAELLLLAAAALLLKGGERVVVGDTTTTAGRGALERLGASLVRDHAAMPAPPLPRHSTVLLIGDFLDPLEPLAAAVEAHASRGVRGYLLQVLDPAEVELPYRGRVRFQGMEQGEDELLVPNVEEIRAAYAQRMREQTAALERIAAAAGWLTARHVTSAAPQSALLALHAALGGHF